MIFKKFTAVVLCVTQLSFILPASADSPIRSSEFELLRSVIALEGAGLSQQDTQTQLNTVLTQYNQTADKTGQIERLQQAFVDLGVYTPDQADVFITNAKIAASSGADLPTMLSRVMSTAPAGAQFSGCIFGGVLLAGVGLIVTFVALLGFGFAVDDPGSSTVRLDVILGGGLGALGGAVAMIVAGAYGKC